MIAHRPKSRRSTRGSSGSRSRESSSTANCIRYAVVGLGHIAQAAVLPAFAHARKNSRLAALVSDDPTKLRKLGRKYKVAPANLVSYDDYNDLLRSGQIDAVYIALPNTMHADYTIRAANAGVHVLCEKPMATTEADCRRMIDACAANSVRLMIAYRLHFEEANLKAMQLARSGKLGDLKFFNSAFSFNVNDPNIRLESELGGGTLYDIGIYCIQAARYLFDDEPIEVSAFTARSPDDERFGEVEETASCIMRFGNDRLATFVTSFGSAATGWYQLCGSKGDLCVDNSYEYSEPMEHMLTVNGKTKTRKFRKRDQFAPELLYFSDCVQRGIDPEPSGQEGLIDVRIIEALYESARSGQPVRFDAAGFPPDRRPTMDQEIRRRPVREPELVHVKSASED